METSRTIVRSPLRILIVKLSALGDIAHALPVVDYIKHYVIDAEIDWVAEERFKELLTAHPMVRHIYAVNTRKLRSNLFSQETRQFISSLQREMKKRRYDVVLDLQGNIKSGIFTMLARSPYRYGFSQAEVREFPNIFATNRRVSTLSFRNIRMKLMNIAAQFLKDFGMTGDNVETYQEKPLQHLIDHDERERQRKYLCEHGWREEPLIAIIPGTTWQTKMWHPGRWLEFMDLVERKDLGKMLILWGNGEERKFSHHIVSSHVARTSTAKANSKPIIWHGGGIKSLIATLSLASVVVGPDTGPVHIAALIGTPTVSFYRATEALRNAPIGKLHASHQSPLPCSPCLKKRCRDDEVCSSSVMAQDIIAGVESVVNSSELS